MCFRIADGRYSTTAAETNKRESEGQNRKQKNRTKTQNPVTDPTKTEREKSGYLKWVLFEEHKIKLFLGRLEIKRKRVARI